LGRRGHAHYVFDKDLVYERLRDLLGDRVNREEHIRHSYVGDTGWLTLYHAFKRIKAPLPDIVVFPKNAEEISGILKVANEFRVPVIPYGGGSGVWGGTIPLYGGIVVDMKLMNNIEINEEAMTVTAEAGVLSYELELKLNERGLTMGHYPASMFSATVGGMLAARSSGVASTKYGKIEDMVLGLEVVLPTGEILRTPVKPRYTGAVGPDLVQLFVGSEGTLGIITRATFQLHLLPEKRIFSAFSFRSLEDGYRSVVKMLSRVTPAVVRLYDEEEVMRSKFKTYTPPEGVRGALLLLIFDGFGEMPELEEKIAREICLENGGSYIGDEPARKWWNERFRHYYPPLSPSSNLPMIYGTIDVAATFDKLLKIYRAVKEALYSRYGDYQLQTAAHFSHWSKSGGMVYLRFYVLDPPADPEKAIELREDIIETAIKITAQMGGIINDHHGVGLDLGRYMELQHGPIGMDTLRRIKKVLDPNGIMNPGKLGL